MDQPRLSIPRTMIHAPIVILSALPSLDYRGV
jgi:hypothetical protein